MDNRTIKQVRDNETKLINEIKTLETQLKKQKEIINKAIKYINSQKYFDLTYNPECPWDYGEVRNIRR